MPTVLCGGGKLSSVSVVSTFYQVIRSQTCAKDILTDMTQSWTTQQAFGGDQAQRILYNHKEVKQSGLQQRQSRGDVPRMTRRPHVAPHKSMLVDDLKLSSDDDDNQRTTHESSSWDGQRVSAHTHSRRVRNSSSDSSGSDATVHSIDSSLPYQSSPSADPDPPSPPATGLPDNQETDHCSSAQWQLDKWLNSQKKLGGGDHYSNQSIPGRLPPLQCAPSPASCWDNQENSPGQSPIPSPRFNYSPPLSLSPFHVTCLSPTSVAGYSPTNSPAASDFPSRSPRSSPLPKERRKSPNPRSPSPTRSDVNHHHQQNKPQKCLPTISHRTKESLHHNKPLKSSDGQQKTRPPKVHSAPTISNNNRRSAQRPGSLLSTSKTRHLISEQGTRSIENSTQKSSADSRSIQRRPLAQPHLKETGQNSHSKAANPSSSRFNPSRQPSAKLEEPTNVHGDHSKRKPQSKREEGRKETSKSDRKNHSRREERTNKGDWRQDKKDKRLAEEQLLRRSWIQSSTEEEDVVDEERQKRKVRRETSSKDEWKTVKAKQKQSALHQGDLYRQGVTGKGQPGEVEPEVLLQSSPDRLSPSSTASSNSESEYEARITKVPADSTSHKRLRRNPKVLHRSEPISGASIEQKQKLYTLVPFGRTDESSTFSQRGLKNLVVQIDLCLLKRVPDCSTSSDQPSSMIKKDKPKETMKHLSETKEAKRKRRLENGVSIQECKRNILDAGGNNFASQAVHNVILKEYLDSKRPMSPLSPLSDSPDADHQKPRSMELLQKNKQCALKPKLEDDCIKVSRNSHTSTEPWSSAGLRGTVSNTETPHHAEYYLHEAKRTKHRADAMVDKLGKAVNYVDAALSFMECGKAMEEGPLEAKSPYTMYSETVELIRYAMRLKSHSGPGARQEEKQLAVLCFRCLALLYWQMFRLKKDHALKYSKVLLEYFKTSSKVPQLSWNDSLKDTVEDSSALSATAKQRRRGSHGDKTSPSHISIPHRIHQMAANHLNITNSVLYSYEYWEVADNLAKESKEFFNYLNTLSGPLTLHSSIAHAVQYTRQALQWIRISAKLN